MRHFHFLGATERAQLFLVEPQEFSINSDPDLLAMALGATLYTPGNRATLADDIAKRGAEGLISSVLCLEDAICDTDVAGAQRNVIEQIRAYHTGLARTGEQGSLLFVRVRSADQIRSIVAGLGDQAEVLAGFVLPKFTPRTGPAYLDEVEKASAEIGRQLLAMPVLESPEVIFAESRIPVLHELRDLLLEHSRTVLSVRIGATDLSSVFGLRRARGMTVYDVGVIAQVIADVVNVLGRDAPVSADTVSVESVSADTVSAEAGPGRGFRISGPVWEYFAASERIFKPQLRESPFVERSERPLRTQIIAKDLDGLIREVALDRANGLTGKTVIHPTHIAAVHALSVVTHEEFMDAQDIVGTRAAGGAAASTYNNKMNESKPHTGWAKRVLQRAEVFGVARPETSFVDLLGAGLRL